MQKDFITANPDSGNGDSTVTVQASENSGNARSTTINISGGGITKTVAVNQTEKPTCTISKKVIAGFPQQWKMIADKPVASQIVVTIQTVEDISGSVIETAGTFTIPISGTESEKKPVSLPMPDYSFRYLLNIQEDSTFRYVLNF